MDSCTKYAQLLRANTHGRTQLELSKRHAWSSVNKCPVAWRSPSEMPTEQRRKSQSFPVTASSSGGESTSCLPARPDRGCRRQTPLGGGTGAVTHAQEEEGTRKGGGIHGSSDGFPHLGKPGSDISGNRAFRCSLVRSSNCILSFTLTS